MLGGATDEGRFLPIIYFLVIRIAIFIYNTPFIQFLINLPKKILKLCNKFKLWVITKKSNSFFWDGSSSALREILHKIMPDVVVNFSAVHSSSLKSDDSNFNDSYSASPLIACN